MFSYKNARPVVMILDGDAHLTLPLAAELWRDLRASIIGVGASTNSPLLRSRYCKIKRTVPSKHDGDKYREAILQLIREHHPDAVLSISHRSVTTLDAIREQVPREVNLCIAGSKALEASLDKSKTLAAAREIGIRVPEDYTALVSDLDSAGRRELEDLQQLLPFPVFLKAAREAHSHITARIDLPSQFWPMYDEMRRLSERLVDDSTILVQEYVKGDGHNCCYGFLFVEDDVELSFGHEKLRAVPREVGSAARVRVFRDDRLRAMSEKLLRELELGNGVALVEYRKRSDGSYVLMEVNPRFWGAYSLAKKSGYHFASTMVARGLGLQVESPPAPVASKREMWFPLREVKFLLKNRGEEPLLRSVIAAGWPPCRWDLEFRDLWAWLPSGGLRGISKKLWNLRKKPERGSQTR